MTTIFLAEEEEDEEADMVNLSLSVGIENVAATGKSNRKSNEMIDD